MRKIWKILAIIAVAGGIAACNKDNNPEGSEGSTDFSGGCEAVDLGLSVKWASYNVGATAPDEHGSYFSWGETTEKSRYAREDYKWGVYDSDDKPRCGMTKYTADVKGGDGLKILEPEDDPATVNWGAEWRTPTYAEIMELLDDTNCEWTWDADRKGYTVFSWKTGNSIFLPAAGSRMDPRGIIYDKPIGGYWSSSVYEPFPAGAYGLSFNPEEYGWEYSIRRFIGLSVRPVTEY